MHTEAAICWEQNTPWIVEQVELDRPRQGEVLVKLAAAGLCHSDEHLVAGDFGGTFPYPVVGGHEGAGVIEEVGPGVTGLKSGDHVVFAFLPACGSCPSCARGRSNLCDNGAILLAGIHLDGSSRMHARGQDVSVMACLGAFSEYTVVNQMSCVKIERDIPLDLACLIGCGVTTGWGSAVYAAEVRPGESVAVIGIGGIGAAALQGARLAGAEKIIAIDPVPLKRDMASRFGATHTAESVETGFDLIQRETRGRMCDKVICAMGVGRGDLMAPILALCAKRGRVVVTNIHRAAESEVKLSLLELTLMEKQIVGSLYGSANMRYDIPQLLNLFRLEQLDLEGMLTNRYKLGNINQGYRDMYEGKNIRGVLIYE